MLLDGLTQEQKTQVQAKADELKAQIKEGLTLEDELNGEKGLSLNGAIFTLKEFLQSLLGVPREYVYRECPSEDGLSEADLLDIAEELLGV